MFNIVGEINEQTYIDLLAYLTKQKRTGPIQLTINSGGGNHMDSLAIYDTLRNWPGEVNILAIGQCQSAAVLIFAAGDVRTASENCWFMVHEDTGKLNGTVAELRLETAQFVRLEAHWAHLMENRTGTAHATWAELSTATTYLDSKEAHELGLVHKILKGKP